MNKTRVVIGIPAHNEENNIKSVVMDIFNQEQISYILKKIIVISDGSVDRTYEFANSIKNEKLLVLKNDKRLGQSASLNKIITFCNTDILVLIDADIRIIDRHFVEKLITPIIDGKAELTSSNIEPISTNTLVRKVLKISHHIKRNVFISFNGGNNVFTCYGLARAMSKELYQKISFPPLPGSDIYSYLFCVANNGKFRFVESAIALYELPDNIKDHLKQSIRYFHSTQAYKNYFDKDTLHELKLPKLSVYIGLLRSSHYLVIRPLHIIAYCLIAAYSYLLSFLAKPTSDRWDVAGSSKKTSL